MKHTLYTLLSWAYWAIAKPLLSGYCFNTCTRKAQVHVLLVSRTAPLVAALLTTTTTLTYVFKLYVYTAYTHNSYVWTVNSTRPFKMNFVSHSVCSVALPASSGAWLNNDSSGKFFKVSYSAEQTVQSTRKKNNHGSGSKTSRLAFS